MKNHFKEQDLVSTMRDFILEGCVDEEFAIATVKMLKTLMSDFKLEYAAANQHLPAYADDVFAAIEPNKHLLAPKQCTFYEGIKDRYDKCGSISENQTSALIGMYARVVRFELK
jgi:hypothetical protein